MYPIRCLVCFLFACTCSAMLSSVRGERHKSQDVRRMQHGSQNGTGDTKKAVDHVFDYFERTFDRDTYRGFRAEFSQGAANYVRHGRGASVKRGYAAVQYGLGRPHCDKGVPGPLLAPSGSEHEEVGVGAFPGGIGTRFPQDFSSLMMEVVGKSPPAGRDLATPMALRAQALRTGLGLVQTLAAGLVHIVPPLISPPAWINMPLPCAPMLTGHNCFGAVLYPITFSDFLVADMTDAMMDGYLAGFPDTYANKVGKTSDRLYKACGSAYFSMHCSAIFPRCTMPMSRDEAIPVGGRVPLCLHLCILPLIMCPGFWLGDIVGSCSFVSVPPVCSQAFFFNLWRLPPQYNSYDEANPFPQDCPGDDDDDEAAVADNLKDGSSTSPIESDAAAAKIPSMLPLLLPAPAV